MSGTESFIACSNFFPSFCAITIFLSWLRGRRVV
nr:MAG TPA: hypothetical protein [Caudoviricetes sp.]